MDNPNDFSQVKTRVRKIVCEAFGANLPGPDAPARAIPFGWFRWSDMPLEGQEAASGTFDRGVHFRWVSGGEGSAGLQNDLDPSVREVHRFRLRVGYVYGPSLTSSLHLAPGGDEDPDVAIVDPDGRAARDARIIRRALGFYSMWAGTVPTIVFLSRDGDPIVEDLGSGRMVSTTTWAADLQIDNTRGAVP